jgi:hypothetical protein
MLDLNLTRLKRAETCEAQKQTIASLLKDLKIIGCFSSDLALLLQLFVN